MILSLGTMVLAIVAVGVGSVVAVDGLHQDLGIASRGFRQLRQLYDVGFLAARARTAADATPPDPAATAVAVRSAIAALDARGGAVDGPPPNWIDEGARADCRRLLTAVPVPFDRLFARLSAVSADVRQAITDAESAADRRRRLAVRAVAGFCAIVAAAAVAVGVNQYRRVVGPVRQLAAGARRFAAGHFEQRIATAGDAEFVDLAADFNRMADDLQQTYRNLEDRVRAAGQELARSERLASVGYLAAGVAHEINNPLGIIAGYGERALRQLPPVPENDRVRQALSVMCDEAFRCKGITDRLLSLSRPGEAGRSPLSLAALAADVATTVAALPAFAGRRVDVATEGDATVTANGGELRQVVLNLIVNALQASAPAGRVTVAVRPTRGGVALTVTDDGRGMTPEELSKAFEPFYTARPGGPPGTGLGLSIAHAIVSAHAGRLTAASGGPGRGSTFAMLLPGVEARYTMLHNETL
jgi:signal transduction histidine kinase